MTTFKSKKVEKSLKKKGFKQEPGDHKFFVLYVDGKRTNIRTKTSHCGQDIDKYLINQMRKQVHLEEEDIINLIKCPLSEEEYKKIVTEGGYID